MKTSTHIKKIALTLITILLIVLWAMVSFEKWWDLEVFHASLLRQPIPKWSADILYWMLPILEIGVVFLILRPKQQKLRFIGMWLSAILMLSFTLFIGLGVLGVYAKTICGCAFFIKILTYEQHLYFNMFFLILSILGIWLTWPIKNANTPYNEPRKTLRNWVKDRERFAVWFDRVLGARRFSSRRHALFRPRS